VCRYTHKKIQIWRFDLRAVEALPEEGGLPVNEKDRGSIGVLFFFFGDDRGFLKDVIKSYQMAPIMSPLNSPT
jgi:hypothetical protein